MVGQNLGGGRDQNACTLDQLAKGGKDSHLQGTEMQKPPEA